MRKYFTHMKSGVRWLLLPLLFFITFFLFTNASNAQVTNGTFTGNTTGWTSSGGWTYATNTAVNGADGSGPWTLSQTVPNVAASGAILKFDVQVRTGGGSIASSKATLNVSYNGVIYATLNSQSVSLTSGTVIPQNGATGSTVGVVLNNATFSTVTYNLPSGLPTSGALVFTMIGGGCANCVHDIAVDNVSLTTPPPYNPGGVFGAAMWVKANAGVTTSGTAVTNWVNQVDATNNYVTGFGPATYNNTASINFNASVDFAANGALISQKGLPATANSDVTKHVAFFSNSAAGTEKTIESSIGTNFTGTYHDNAEMNINSVLYQTYNSSSVAGGSSPAGSIVSQKPLVGTAVMARGVTSGSYGNINGTTGPTATYTPTYSSKISSLGALYNSTQNAWTFDGKIPEFIVFPMVNTATQITQVESYLAVKYGVTLSKNYLASDGTTTTYAVSGYGNNIAGVGRDDITALNQKESQSVNSTTQVTMALSTFTATNDANANTFSANKQFMIWGDDAGSITATTAITGPGVLNKRLNRTWRLQNTNSFGQQVTVYFPTASVTVAGSQAGSIIYAPTAAGLSSNTSVTAVAGTTTATINGVASTGFVVTFPTTGVLYFTFAGSDCVAPIITAQPQNATICAPGTTTFSVAATGATSYLWYINYGAGWQALNNNYSDANGSWSNGTTNTLTVTANNTNWNTYTFQAVAINGTCTASSSIATLTVNAAPVVTTQPLSQTLCIGATATFTGAASGGAPYTYQWESSTNGGAIWYNEGDGAWANGAVTGATTASMTKAVNATTTRGQMWRLKVTNGCGTITTNAATLTIGNPVISTQPVSQTVCVNNTTTFTATVTSATTYQWQLNQGGGWGDLSGLGNTYSDVNVSWSGGGTSTLTVTPKNTLPSGWQFRLVASNGSCTVTSSAAALTVTAAPTLSALVPQTICVNGTANFSVTASGTGNTYAWYYDGTNLITDGTFPNAVNTGSTTATLNITALNTIPNGRIITVVVTSPSGCVTTSSGALLTVNTCATTVQLSAKVFLQGAYTSGTAMRNDLLTGVASGTQLSVLPALQPYGTGQNAGSTYTGTETVNSFPATAVDWVLVQLRSTAGGNNVATRAGLLLQNGSIVDITAGFTSPLTFTVAPGSYYVVVHGRNHLGVMSAAPVALTAANTVYDFTTGNDKAYTGALVDQYNTPMTQLAGGMFGLWGGDANHDSQIYYFGPGSDAESITLDYLGGDGENGYNILYEAGDINMDGQTYYFGPGSDAEWLTLTALTGDAENGYISEQVPVQATPGGRMAMPARRGPLKK